ncbi:hypothetical protein GPROT2_02017 [Gammaproteobacteria bacterium]|nr:outer membrane beta-barrel protein [Gammaproteobacteria bacterium]QOJ31464.1 MAG: outer membrane beta-barrel protein [Gammaproteobacteria bacterium]CAG0943124.1 hypothetical protein GPROT2_02017 [Gammaproteobacteria bacterium]
MTSILKRASMAILALLPMTAVADVSWYVGGGVGGAKLEEDVDVAIGAFVNDGSGGLTPLTCQQPAGNIYGCTPGQPVEKRLGKFRGSDLGYRLFGGVRFGRYFGIEAGYVDLGEPEDSLDLAIPPSATSPETDVALKLSDEIHGIDAYLVGALPLGERWEVIAKLGMISWDSTFKARNAYGETFPNTGTATLPTVLPSSFSVGTDGTDLAGAIGFNYKASEHMTLRAEGSWYDIEDTEQAWLLGGFVIYTF